MSGTIPLRKENEPVVTQALPWAPGQTITGDAMHVARYIEQIERQRVARTQWPEDNHEQMTALARLFPSLNHHDGTMVMGCHPWDPVGLVEWLNTSGEPTSGSRQAAMFLLSVWNRDDWC